MGFMTKSKKKKIMPLLSRLKSQKITSINNLFQNSNSNRMVLKALLSKNDRVLTSTQRFLMELGVII